jgi:hypothetical protein
VRDNLIMSYIVQTLAANKVRQAHLVIGAMHAKTLPRLCKQWNMKYRVVEH